MLDTLIAIGIVAMIVLLTATVWLVMFRAKSEREDIMMLLKFWLYVAYILVLIKLTTAIW